LLTCDKLQKVKIQISRFKTLVPFCFSTSSFFRKFIMLGHHPVTLNRLNNIKNTLEASIAFIQNIMEDPNVDKDFLLFKMMLNDAVFLVEQMTITSESQD
jgi:hypothetical protein